MNVRPNTWVSVEEAEEIILGHTKNFGTEIISFQNCLGRILAEDIKADRDLPPFNRVTMDGIAIHSDAISNSIFSFHIKATQSAGDAPINIAHNYECIEIMTGASLPESTDTVIPYEDIEIKNNIATVKTNATLVKNQNIHFRGKDKKKGEVLAKANQVITPTVVTVAAAVGKTEVLVKKMPKVLIISTGDELVDVHEQPTPFQIRRSNNYALHAVLTQHALEADVQHLPDDKKIIEETLSKSLKHYDVILLSGGVSMGKFDYVPAALEQAGVTKFFHKIKQRPGKPFWFGVHADRAFVFAFPGNPVASFLCLHRYFLPWIKKCFDIETQSSYAILNDDFHFNIELQHFLQVKLKLNEKGELLATPVGGNGSGDFVNLLQADAFMELPLEKKYFKKGESFKVWTFKQII